MKRRKLISIDDYVSGKTEGLSRLQKDLNILLKPIIFNLNSMQDILFNALKFIKPVNRTVKNNNESIDKAIYQVLTKLGFLKRKSVIYKLTDKGKEPLSNKKEDP